jgi:hypothetical protein
MLLLTNGVVILGTAATSAFTQLLVWLWGQAAGVTQRRGHYIMDGGLMLMWRNGAWPPAARRSLDGVLCDSAKKKMVRS